MHVLGVAGVVVWAVELAFEAVGDAQLARFRADPANKGRVLDTGLWRYTRHPNTSAGATVWLGLWLSRLRRGRPGRPGRRAGRDDRFCCGALVSGLTLLVDRSSSSAGLSRGYVRRTRSFVPRPAERLASMAARTVGVDLYWLRLGAGGHYVRLNGRV